MKIKGKQINQPLSGSFSGSFVGDGSGLTGVGTIFNTSSFVLTSSFNQFTSSVVRDSASFDSTIKFISGSYTSFTQSYYFDSYSLDIQVKK